MSDDVSPEGRINIKDVPDQISKIFFGNGGNRPSYLDDGYGVPQSPVLSPGSSGSGSGSGFNPGFTTGGVNIFYQGYEDDIYLLIKLGQAALIIFMIFAIFSIIFMMTTCCITLFGAINDKNNDQSNPAPFTMKKQDSKPGFLTKFTPRSSSDAGGQMTRSQGMTNLAQETEESESESASSEELQVTSRPMQETRFTHVPLPGMQRPDSNEKKIKGTNSDTPRHETLSSSTSSSSSLSHNRSLPYYEVPTPSRTIAGNRRRTDFGSFSPQPTTMSTTPNNQRLII